MNWQNFEHCHSAIGFVTPAQRRAGLDGAILKARTHVYEYVRQMNPWRWSGRLRNWASVTEVHLNPDSPQTQAQKNC